MAAFLSRVSQSPALAVPEGAQKRRFRALVRQALRSAQAVPKVLYCQRGLLTSLGLTGGAGTRCSGCLYRAIRSCATMRQGWDSEYLRGLWCFFGSWHAGRKTAARAAQSGARQGQQVVRPQDRPTHPPGEPASQPFAAKRLSLWPIASTTILFLPSVVRTWLN